MGQNEEVSAPDVDSDRPQSRKKLARLHEWVFLTGNRMVIASILLLAFFVIVAYIELRIGTTTQQIVPLFYLVSAIVGGDFTLLTIVISINQLVISRQLSAPGELRERIENTTAYRNASIELVETEIPPPTPAAFLDELLNGVQNSVTELESHRSAVASNDAVEAIDRVLDPLKEQIGRSMHELEAENATTFEALVVTLNTNYSDDINQILRLKTAYGGELSPNVNDCLDTLVTGLKQIDVARQYLKTVYIQGELARLSRNLLYIGVPVIFAELGLLVVIVSAGRTVLSATQLSVITPVFTVMGVAPLAVLFAYVLRLSVVSERTAAITPFTTPTQEATPVEAITEDAEE